MKICILIGSADISGGSYVIFEHCLYLQARGFDVTCVLTISDATSKWHPALDSLKFRTLEQIDNSTFDIAIATWWRTIFDLHRVEANQYCYFVQSIESWFYPDSDVAVRNLVNSTYIFGLPTITEATWIKRHLLQRFDVESHLVRNGCSKSIYQSQGPSHSPRESGKLRVLVEGPFGIDFKNVARTIALLRRSEADEIWLLTATELTSYPGVSRVFSRVPAYECSGIYRSCDVLVKLSYIEGMFGPPLEMFHCGGTAVVYDVTGHDEYISHGRNALVVTTGDEAAVIAAVNQLRRSPELLTRLKSGAAETAARWPDWTQSGAEFQSALTAIASNSYRVPRARLRTMSVEIFQQYVRTEKALAANQRQWSKHQMFLWARRCVQRLTEFSPTLRRLAKLAQMRFLEERQTPARRSKI